MDLTLGIAATCVIQIFEVDLEPRADGWTESLHVEIVAPAELADREHLGSPCPTVTLPLPAGARTVRTRGRSLLVDATRRRVTHRRVETTPPRLDRSRSSVVHVPEIRSPGDRVVLDIVRELPAGPVRWSVPAARYLRVASGGTLTAPDGLTRDTKRGSVWGHNVTDAVVTATSDRHPAVAPASAMALAPDTTTVEGRETLVVPQVRDVLVALYPGAGSTHETQLFVTLPPSDEALGWIVPAPPGARVDATVSPPSRARVVEQHGITRIEAPPSEGPSAVSVRWSTPYARTYGAVPVTLGPGSPGRITNWTVAAGRGVLSWDDAGRTWALAGIDGQPVIPDQGRFLDALARRFQRQSVPEPGFPPKLRGAQPSPELAAALLPAMQSRVGMAADPWPHDPLWPRKLRRAHRAGVLTPTEAALTLWLMARQVGFSAGWAMVRPATGPDDAGAFRSPAGFDRPVVVLYDLPGANGPVFLDPACEACGPFELPLELWDAPVLAPGLDRTPPPPRGNIEVGIDDEGRRTYRFEGPAALELRRGTRTPQDVAAFVG
ncbi:MAG: hypothetical protein AAF602_17100, partial [Myxococcota bacterium]